MIDAATLVTRVHRDLGAEGYRTVFDAASSKEVAAVRAPAIIMCLARLGLAPMGRGARKPRPGKKP